MSAFDKETCPYCGEKDCQAEWCDVGVGYVQCGPYHCPACHATEIGPHDEAVELSAEEKRTGWYAPGKPSPFVSSINGTMLEQETALWMYREGLVETVPFHLTLSEEESKELWGRLIRNKLDAFALAKQPESR